LDVGEPPIFINARADASAAMPAHRYSRRNGI
jgi:hypothetical protein